MLLRRRLYTTIVRYDPVYHGHFKCNAGMSRCFRSQSQRADNIVRHDYPHINRWLKNLYWNYPAFKETTDFERQCYTNGLPRRVLTRRYQGALLLLAFSDQPQPYRPHRSETERGAFVSGISRWTVAAFSKVVSEMLGGSRLCSFEVQRSCAFPKTAD